MFTCGSKQSAAPVVDFQQIWQMPNTLQRVLDCIKEVQTCGGSLLPQLCIPSVGTCTEIIGTTLTVDTQNLSHDNRMAPSCAVCY